MKRDAKGKFVNSWDSETKQRVSVSITNTAWQLLDEEAHRQGTSRSEVIEHFARSLENRRFSETNQNGTNAQINLLQAQILEQQQAIEALQRQKQALEALLENTPDAIAQVEKTERKVALILESITDAFVAFDREWRYTYVNWAAARILKKTREELLGKHVWTEVFPELEGGLAHRVLHQAVVEQVPVSWEECVSPDGCWLEANAYPFVGGIAVYFRDITERKQAEAEREKLLQALKNQQRWFEQVLDLMPTPMIFIEPETAKVTFSNRLANELAGGDLPKNKSIDEYHEVYYCTNANGERIPAERMPAVLIARGERLQNYEMNWYTPDGVRVVLCWGEMLPAMYGQPAVGIGMFQDVTRLKRIEENLRQTEERLQLALSSVKMFAWDVDLVTQEVICSSNALEIWGAQAGLEQDFFSMIHPEDQDLVIQEFQRAVAEDQICEQEYRVVRPDGVVRWLNSQGRVYRDETGRQSRMIGVSVDITERKQILKELQQTDLQQQFLIELNDLIRPLQDAKEIIWQVANATGQYLQVTRCTYGEIDSTQEYVIVDRDFCNGVISVAGKHHMNSFGPEIILQLKQGNTIVVNNVDCDPRTAGSGTAAFDAIQTKSLLCVPLVKEGKFVALFVLHHVSPREWTEAEVSLMERIAQQTWLAVDRARAEEDLRESEAHLQLALKVGRMGTWEWDILTNALLWSEGHFTVLGLQPNECEPSYEVWASRVHPEDLEEVQASWQQAIATQQEYYQEYRLRWSDGSVHWVEARGQFTYDEQGNPKHSIGAVVDITERKHSEEALRQALQKLNFHVENTPMAVVEWDYDFRVTRWSAAAERILGWPAKEVIGKSLADIPFIFEEDLEAVTEVCKRLVFSHEPHIFSYNRNYTQDGRVVHCEWYNSSLRDESGRMVSVLSLVLDVTERKQAEQEREQLLERERIARHQVEAVQRQLTTIFETSPIGLALLDSEQRFAAINEALAEINGLSREQHLGSSIAELFSQVDSKIVETFDQIYATGQPFISPSFAVNVPGRSDRRPGYYNVYYLPAITSEGQVENVLVYVVDVTEQVRLELGQRFLSEAGTVLASSLDYQTTLERVAQLVVPELADWCTVHIVEEDGSIEQIAVAHTNPAKLEWAYQIRDKYPLNPEDPRGTALTLRTGQSDLVPEIPDELLIQAARDPEHLEILRQVGFNSVMTVPLRTQSRIFGAISFIAAESGRQYTPMDLELAEELARRASLAVDNAQLYRAAQRDRAASEAARSAAEAANRIKDEFLAVLSHELRSPLNPILGWTKLLRTGRLDASKAEHALETIERNAKLQSQLIEDLLDVSRILQGKLTLNVAPVNLATTIEAAMETVRLAAEAKNIQIQALLNPILQTVLGDTNRLQQVIWNLLSNAVKFTPPGGQIEVELIQRGAYAQIKVRDNGRGIHPDFLPCVFDYFRQEDGTTTRQFGGLGLGLAIVRHLTELHGGTVQVESPGQNLGATFTVRLPLNVVLPEPVAEDSLPEKATSLSGIQVLVVDDDADMRELASFVLMQAGAEVRTAASAAQALMLLKQAIPDLLLSDIGMPEMDGYALIRHIRRRTPEQGGSLPAIALSAYAGEINQQQALAAGFQMHLSKPIEPESLVKAIASLVAVD
ncbi:MAG TPA: PAS domain S-box protein [Trichocoleus sp.]